MAVSGLKRQEAFRDIDIPEGKNPSPNLPLKERKTAC
jgi:hypothetical protein